jgi:MoaA/NifB/PqqE/SkfB family radical SAM enzyme
MSMEVAEKIGMELSLLTNNGRRLRLDMALRGEPMLHPLLTKLVSIFRYRLPHAQISMVTNGYRLRPYTARVLFECGMNFIYLDCYNNSYSHWYDTFMKCDEDFAVREARDITHWKWHGNKKRCLILGQDIRTEKKSTRNLVSFCQVLPENNCKKYNIERITEPLQKRCADPFRSMNITYNGNVILCCRDWDETRIMYRLMRTNSDLIDYWYHDLKLNSIRTLLWYKHRNFTPCNKCEYNGGVYLGNLPSVGRWNEDGLKKLITNNL